MITLSQFIAKYQNKIVSYPVGMYTGECLSLVKMYLDEVFGVSPPSSGVGAAWGYWKNFPKPLGEVFNKITIDVPRIGDIVIWDRSASLPFGHIAISVYSDTLGFVSFESNWLGDKKAKFIYHPYDGVLGWLNRNS